MGRSFSPGREARKKTFRPVTKVLPFFGFGTRLGGEAASDFVQAFQFRIFEPVPTLHWQEGPSVDAPLPLQKV